VALITAPHPPTRARLSGTSDRDLPFCPISRAFFASQRARREVYPASTALPKLPTVRKTIVGGLERHAKFLNDFKRELLQLLVKTIMRTVCERSIAIVH
jgi:hypothetical protein